MAAGVAPGLEVVADHHRIEAHGLGVDRELEQLAGRELFGRGLVAEREHGGPRCIAVSRGGVVGVSEVAHERASRANGRAAAAGGPRPRAGAARAAGAVAGRGAGAGARGRGRAGAAPTDDRLLQAALEQYPAQAPAIAITYGHLALFREQLARFGPQVVPIVAAYQGSLTIADALQIARPGARDGRQPAAPASRASSRWRRSRPRSAG